jgi:hypothetical protein
VIGREAGTGGGGGAIVGGEEATGAISGPDSGPPIVYQINVAAPAMIHTIRRMAAIQPETFIVRSLMFSCSAILRPNAARRKAAGPDRHPFALP